MNHELVVILAGMLEIDYGICSGITRGSYQPCKGVQCNNCVGSFAKKQNPDHYLLLITSIPLWGFI